MKLCVVGGAGLIGSAVVKKALERDWRVTVIDNLSKNIGAIKSDLPYLQLIIKDIDQIEAPDVKHSDFLVNLAALTMAECARDPAECIRVNYKAAVQLGKLCDRFEVKHAFASSCSSYGTQDGLANEDSPLYPVSNYAKAKVNAEKALNGVKVRFATAYGISVRFRPDLILHEFCMAALAGEIGVYGPELWRPICHYKDLAEGILRAVELGKNGETYNIGSTTQNYTKMQLAQMVQEQIPCDIKVVEDIADPRNYRVSFHKAQEKLDFRTAHSPEATIAEFKHHTV